MASSTSAAIALLWMFAENDHCLGFALARQMFEGYASAGAPAQLKELPPFGSDGHLLLIARSTDLWWPSVESFPGALHLPTSLAVDLPPPPSMPPPQTSDACLGFFRDNVAARTDAKAFAVNPEGHYGTDVTARSLDDARQETMKLCSGRRPDCKLYAAGQELVERAN